MEKEKQNQIRWSLPYEIVLGGMRQQLRKGVCDDLSAYKKGVISLFTGDYYELPVREEQTNFMPYLGCDYAVKNGVWYVCFERRWNRCEPDEVQEYVFLGGRKLTKRGKAEEDLTPYEVGLVSHSTGSWFDVPTAEEQTNIGALVGCRYAFKDGEWYLYNFDQWWLLKPIWESANDDAMFGY